MNIKTTILPTANYHFIDKIEATPRKEAPSREKETIFYIFH